MEFKSFRDHYKKPLFKGLFFTKPLLVNYIGQTLV